MLMLKLRTTQLRGRRAGKNATTAPMLGDSSDTETKDTIVKQYRRRGRRGTCVR